MSEVPKIAIIVDFSTIYSRVLPGIAKYCRLHPLSFHGETFYPFDEIALNIRKLTFTQLTDLNAKGVIIADVSIPDRLIKELVESSFPTIIKNYKGSI